MFASTLIRDPGTGNVDPCPVSFDGRLHMKIRVLAATAAAVAALAVSASPAFAHDCFNPTKDAHAPTAGVHYTLVGFDQNGPIFVQTANGKGIGGFVAIAPGVFGPD